VVAGFQVSISGRLCVSTEDSVVSYAVAGRQREIGVRIALGATPARIQRMVVGEGSAVVAVGIAGGLVAARYGTRFAQSMLYAVRATDPAMYIAATLLLAAVAFAATLMPARRAGRPDPVEVQRGEE